MNLHRPCIFHVVIAALCISFSSCNHIQRNTEFENFISQFPDIKAGLTLSDTIEGVFYSDTGPFLMDSNLVIKYELADKYLFCEDGPPGTLKEMEVHPVGKFRGRHFTALLSSLITCKAGSGLPVILLTTYDYKGKVVDQMRFLEYLEKDPLTYPYQISSIISDSLVIVTDIEEKWGFLKKKRLLKSKDQHETDVKIDDFGKITDKSGIWTNLYFDSNSAIIDTFPAE